MKQAMPDDYAAETLVRDGTRSLREELEKNKVEMKALAWANSRIVLVVDALQALADAERELHLDGDTQAFYRKLTRGAMKMLGVRYGAFGLFGEDGALAEFLAEGMSKEVIDRIGASPGGLGLLGEVYQREALVRVDDIKQHPGSCGFPEGHPQMRCLMGLPFVINGVTRGALYLADKHDGRPFSDSDEEYLRIYARDVSYLLERHQLVDALKTSNEALQEEKNAQSQLLERVEEMQAQLVQSEKLAALGQLAAGVAHEINNPIGYISSNLRTLEQYVDHLVEMVQVYGRVENALADQPELLQELRTMKEQADLEYIKEDSVSLVRETCEGITRVKRIVQDLKDFSRVGETGWQRVDLHQGLDSTLNIVNNEIKYKAEVVKEYGEIPEIECIPSQLNQVFMNLLVNAAQAIEERGTITIRTGRLGEARVSVEISDTGKGIDDAYINNVFDPFFTTKPVGKGTGLGLSLSHSIVKKHGGRIEVESECGKGTTFRVLIPVTRPHAETEGGQ